MAGSFLGILSYLDYIKINWKKIDADIFHFFTKAKDGKIGAFEWIKKQLFHTLPLMGGFSASFYYAFQTN